MVVQLHKYNLQTAGTFTVDSDPMHTSQYAGVALLGHTHNFKVLCTLLCHSDHSSGTVGLV